MPQDINTFLQYLTVGLIVLLFADKYAPAIFKKLFGVEVEDDTKRILENHEQRLEVANREMGEVKTLLEVISEDIKEIKNKLWPK